LEKSKNTATSRSAETEFSSRVKDEDEIGNEQWFASSSKGDKANKEKKRFQRGLILTRPLLRFILGVSLVC
jgi:hypothetical protein